MKTRTILGMSLAAVMVIAIVPAFATASYYYINDAEVREKNIQIIKTLD